MLRFDVVRCISLLFIFFISPVDKLLAQQDPLSSLWWKNITTLNPAYSGLEYKHFANVQVRDQWQNLENNPQTFWASYDMKADFLHGGIGLNYERDAIGMFVSDKIKLNYNYQIVVQEKHKFTAGISLGLNQQSIDWGEFIVSNNPAIDPYIPPDKKETKRSELVGLGLSYMVGKFNFGFSMNNITHNEFQFSGYYDYQTYAHYYLTSSYLITASDKIAIQPQFIYRGVNSDYDSSFDLNLRTIYKERYWVGITYRQESWLALMAGFEVVKKIQIAYSYDIYDQAETSFDLGQTHELTLSFFIK